MARRPTTPATAPETIGVAPGGKLEIRIRDFLSSIAPGMFLVSLVYLYEPAILDTSTNAGIYKPILFLLILIPAGYITNGISYYVLGGAVRSLEGLLLRCDFVCSKFVTLQNFQEMMTYFGLGQGKARDRLLFRYECEAYIKTFRNEFYRHFGDIVGIEILKRNIALLALASLVYSNSQHLYVLGLSAWAQNTLTLSIAIIFIILSALDSAYVGVHSIHSVYVICRYELERDEPLAWREVAKILYAPPAATTTTG